MKPAFIALLTATFLDAHRLDEYLQATIVAIERNQIEVQLALTPGVAVFPSVIAAIDANHDGSLSAAERQSYAAAVLRDLQITIDGQPLTLHPTAADFPPVDQMEQGQAAIQFTLTAAFPPGARNRKLTLRNNHQKAISAYQINCLSPRDPGIHIVSQNRNYTQSHYELSFEDTTAPLELSHSWLHGVTPQLGMLGLALGGWLAVLWRRPPPESSGPA